ncbi:hypothetical protein [Rhodococcus tukisamuensis]|uniref:Secreted protein n=1 Tax=Rhodococcus tukisamuensis TaxID=168276 RepID=A0A1G7C674_9NOCA|nr:hypothetical protein [Rhodococcus tukisamuensis]SDE34733.1 hypothetical protein SAMN05444580_11530 [Rhodococcus tukisamuensis]
MRKALSNNTTRRRAAVTTVGIATAAALAVPGVAWANDAIPSTSPVVVSIPATQTVPATQSEPTLQSEPAVAGCATAPARVLSPEEVDALIAKGEIAMDTTAPATAVETANDPSATVIRLDEINMGTAVPSAAAEAVDDVSATVIRLAELVGEGQTVADLIARGADALTGPDAAVAFALPTC